MAIQVPPFSGPLTDSSGRRNQPTLNAFLLNFMEVQLFTGFPGSASGKELACQCRRCKRHRFDPWVGKILWRREWQPTSVFLSGEFHGQRSLEGYSPWGCKELDMTKVTWHAHTVIYNVVFTFCQMVK